MANYDLSGIINDAKKFAGSNNGPREYKYPIVYPGTGRTDIKLLFNPASNSVARQIYRHTIDESNKVACMKTWGKDCPLCAAIDEITTINPKLNLSKSASRGRFISFAQFISADYKLSNENIKEGTVILFMYPWTVHKRFQQIFNLSSDYLDDIISKNAGVTITVMRESDNTYDAQLTPSTLRSAYKSFDTDEEYDALLMSLENLNEQVLPSTPPQDLYEKLLGIANDFRAMYIKKPVPPNEVPEQTAMNLTSMATKPDDDIPFNTAPVTGADGNPECYGKYGTRDENICLMCPAEVGCMDATDR